MVRYVVLDLLIVVLSRGVRWYGEGFRNSLKFVDIVLKLNRRRKKVAPILYVFCLGTMMVVRT